MTDEYVPEGLAEYRKEMQAHNPGAMLLDDLNATIRKFCVLPSREHVDAVTLWDAATHCLPAFDHATRLIVRSAEKRSGKSRLLEIIDGTCHDPLRTVNATTPAVFRSLGGQNPPTLLFDEADTQFGSRKAAENNEDLRGLLNAGYQRGLPVLRTVGPNHQPVEFDTFAMAALAGIGRMPDTIEDRAVVIPMRRRKSSEPVTPFRLRRDKPELEKLRSRLADWAAGVRGQLADADPDLPVEDRQADTWAPLVAVADAAGGDWPTRARMAAIRLCEEADNEAVEQSVNVRLLADIREEFKGSFMKSADLCDALKNIEDAPWRGWDLNPSKLGRRLGNYGITTGRDTTGRERGYRIEDFADAFARYLTPLHADKVSDGVQGVREGHSRRPEGTPDLTLSLPSDALKVSTSSKVSDEIRRADGRLTPWAPSDALAATRAGNGHRLTDVQARGIAAKPGRCGDCDYHVPTQGHHGQCPARTKEEI